MTEVSKRTHRDRLAALCESFGRRKEIAKSTGRKHDVSIAKICADASVDKTYLFGYRLKEGDKDRAAYIKLKDEILEFQKNLSSGLEKSQDKQKIELLERKYKALLEDVEPIQRELAYYKNRSVDDLGQLDYQRDQRTQLLARIAQLESDLLNAPKLTNLKGAISVRVQTHLISLDSFRGKNGSNNHKDSRKYEQAAWGKAYKRLEELLSRSLKMRLYILVGLPCSGKSTWAQEGNFHLDRHPVIWDATNLTTMDRCRFVYSISRFSDLPKVVVYFDTDMETIRERNRTLRTAGKRLSDEELRLMQEQLEKPDPYEEAWIDELIVVRGCRE